MAKVKPVKPGAAKKSGKPDAKAGPKSEGRTTRTLTSNRNESRQTRRLTSNRNESRQTRGRSVNRNESLARR